MVFCAPGHPIAKAEDWFTPGRFAILLAVLIGASFPRVILGWETFVFRDFGIYSYPVAFYQRECFWRGELPLWNPLNNCGIPFMAQWTTMVFYPLSLFYLLFPLSWSLGFFCLMHLFLAGLGMYFLAWRWTGNRLGACVAGLAFAFNGLTLNCLMWPNYMAVLGWMPWVILAGERAWQEGGRWLVFAAGVGATQMLGGAPETILFTWLVLALIWIMQLAGGKLPRKQVAIRFVAVIIMVSGLAAVQLLPFGDLVLHSQRDTHYANDAWSMPGTGWANLLAPLFGCFRSPSGVYFQIDQYCFSSYYLGIGVFALALFAVMRIPEPRIWMLGMVAGLGLVFALGDQGFVYGWLRGLLPQLGFVRYPVKWVILTIVTVPLLAGFGVRELTRHPANHRRHLVGLWLILGMMTGVVLWFSRHNPAAGEQWTVTARNGLERFVFLTLILGTLHRWGRVTQAGYGGAGLALLFLLIWLDVKTHVPPQNPTAARSIYEPGFRPASELNPKPVLGQSRAALRWAAYQMLQNKALTDSNNSFLCSRLWLFDNVNLLEEIAKVDGFYALYPRETFHLLHVFKELSDRVPAAWLNFLGVSQITDAKKDLEWEPRSTYLPMITAGQQPVFVASSNTLSLVVQPTFAPAKEVYLPMEAKSLVSVTHPTDARILAQRVTAQRMQIEVSASQPSMVVAAMSFYHNWRATIDGQPTRLWRANYAFQALEVPAGRHQVELVYVDWSFRLGAAISILMVVGCSILAWFQTGIRETD